MEIYVCDGSYKNDMVGIGIVWIKGKNKNTYHFSTPSKVLENYIHEKLAVLKTLELIDQNKSKNATIYNDCVNVVYKLRYKSEHAQSDLMSQIHDKVTKMKENGFTITFLSTTKLKEKHHYELAHELSREYLKRRKKKKDLDTFVTNNAQKKKETKLPVMVSPKIPNQLKEESKQPFIHSDALKSNHVEKEIKKPIIQSHLLKNGIRSPIEKLDQSILSSIFQNKKIKRSSSPFLKNSEIFKMNKTMLKERYSNEQLHSDCFLIEERKLMNVKGFVFQRITNRYWGIFSTDEQLLFISQLSFIELAIVFFDTLSKLGRRKVVLNEHFLSCLKGTFQGLEGKSVTEGQLKSGEMNMKEITRLLNEFNIYTFKDFLFSENKKEESSKTA